MKFTYYLNEIICNVFSKKYEDNMYIDVLIDVKKLNLKEIEIHFSHVNLTDYSYEKIEEVNMFKSTKFISISNNSNILASSIVWDCDDVIFYLTFYDLNEKKWVKTNVIMINNLCFEDNTVPWNQSVYFIMIDRYTVIENNQLLNDEDFYAGGTFIDVINSIESIAGLGYTIVYISPIMESLGYHGYNQLSLKKINPRFGDTKSFNNLIELLNEENISLGLEIVLNHMSVFSEEFMKAVKKDSIFLDVDASGYYKKYLDKPDLIAIDYNYHNIEEMSELVADFLSQYPLSFVRLDSCDHIHSIFANRIIMEFRKRKIITIGECWSDYSNFLVNYDLDGATNYELYGLIIRFFIQKDISAQEFENALVQMLFNIGYQKSNYMLNFIDNHDIRRISDYTKSTQTLINMLAFLFIYIGIPCIYYGTESITDDVNGFNRRGLTKLNNDTISSCIKNLNKLRKTFYDDQIEFCSENFFCIKRKTTSGVLTYVYSNSEIDYISYKLKSNETLILIDNERIDIIGNIRNQG